MNFACQGCKKRPATVHLTDITPQGEKRERHLCEHCAETEGVTPKPQPQQAHLSHILSAFVEGSKTSVQKIADLSCPHCHMTFVEFRSSGLLGCSNDYDAFEQALAPLIERAHQGCSHHVGKAPKHNGETLAVENDLIRLRRQLNQAVDEERFEDAAKLRDHIRTLES